jgi:hypothetical protein
MLVPLSCSEPPREHETPPGASVSEILRAVSREVADAGQSACGLQDTLSCFVLALGQQNRVVEAFQALDLLTQQLQGVAAFLDALAPTLPTDWMGDAAAAAQAVTLSNLAHRLGRPHDDRRCMESEDAGALDLFGADDA